MTWDNYSPSQIAYDQTWRIYNEHLYSLVEDHPGHHSFPACVAKVGHVARGFAAGLERQAVAGTGGMIPKVAWVLHDNAELVDGLINDLQEHANDGSDVSSHSLEVVVAVHGQVTNLIGGVTRDGNALRSFVSKYLHFACPGVPIYDSRVTRVIRRVDWYPYRGRAVKVLAAPQHHDQPYFRFCNQFLCLWRDAMAAGIEPTVRSLDQYMLYLDDLGLDE